MTPSSGMSAHGTLLQMGDGATPEVFATIAEVGDIDGPSLKAVMEDFTTHGSGGNIEKKPILFDGDQIKFPVNFVSSNATHDKTTGIIAVHKAKTLKNWKVVFPDSSGFSLAAHVEEIKFKAPVKGKLTADVTLSVTGAITPL